MSNKKVKKIKVQDLDNEMFPFKEILKTKKERGKRKMKLRKAVMLGALHQMPVTLTFKAAHGFRKIETIAVALTKKYLSVKGGHHVPINRIYNVKLL